MTNEQLAILINKQSPKHADRDKIIEWVFRGFLALLVWLGVQLNQDVDTLKNDVATITTQKFYSERDLSEFKEYMKVKRFTRDNFDNLSEMPFSIIKLNNNEILKINQSIIDLDKRVLKLEYNHN